MWKEMILMTLGMAFSLESFAHSKEQASRDKNETVSIL